MTKQKKIYTCEIQTWEMLVYDKTYWWKKVDKVQQKLDKIVSILKIVVYSLFLGLLSYALFAEYFYK